MTASSGDVIALGGAILEAIGDSALFGVIKWFLILYSLVLIFDVVALVALRGVVANLKTTLYGTQRPLVSKNTLQKRWDRIQRLLLGQNPSHHKAAILEADQLADEILRESGFAGANLGERLTNIHHGQLQTYAALHAAHLVRNRIVNERDFTLTQAEAEKLLQDYQSFFSEMELF